MRSNELESGTDIPKEWVVGRCVGGRSGNPAVWRAPPKRGKPGEIAGQD